MRIRATASLLGGLLLMLGGCSEVKYTRAEPVGGAAVASLCLPGAKGAVGAAQPAPIERQLVYGRDEAVKAARRYAREARALGGSRDPLHPDETHALRTLAEAIAYFPEGSASAEAIRNRADAIQSSEPNSLTHGDDLKGGLSESLDLLDRFGRDRSLPGVEERAREARKTVNAIIWDKPLLGQLPTAHKAMRQVGDALVFAAESLPVERQPVRGFSGRKPGVDQP
jgi:hypothetical protein